MNEYDVIIVGAGICGLTAAFELARENRKILILEAENEPGGRAKSVQLPNGAYLNLGANWLHGGDDNPFYQWAKAHYDLGPLNEDMAEKTRVAIKDGKDVTPMFEVCREKFEQAYEAANHKNSLTFADVVRATGAADVEKIAEFWATLWMAADDPASVSARDFFEDPLGIGGWQLQKGLSHLVTQMVDDVKSRGVDVHLAEPISAISGNTVSTGQAQYSAPNIIVTTSVGVLKSDAIAFDTDVSRILAQKLDGVTMGNFFKMCVPMTEAFFEGRNIPENYPVCLLDDDPCFIHARTAAKPTITVFTGGIRAKEMEMWDAREIQDFAYDAIRRSKLFDDFEDYVAGDVIQTFWSNHPYYRGTYAVHKPGHERTDLISHNGLIFAGEGLLADPKDSPGQVAGAWKAGLKAARLING